MATKPKTGVTPVVPADLETSAPVIHAMAQEFSQTCEPLERATALYVLTDEKTGAKYCECHIKASKLIALGTTDVPLDPEGQPEYRANRDIWSDHVAFGRMQEDAKERRTFSNIVAEFTTDFDSSHPIKIIGGQHRFQAIREALGADVDEHHGVKVYFGLNSEQRLDVQLISNTNIAVSNDLYDRMQETVLGPDLRNWCQEVGLLEERSDFSDKRKRGKQITVQFARTFIVNYYKGCSIDAAKFDEEDTTPVIPDSGTQDDDWTALRKSRGNLWADNNLKQAAREFALLIKAQRAAFRDSKKNKHKPDYPEKASSMAVVAAWAYVAGVLQSNEVRLKRHFELRLATGKDPLNVAALESGRHKSDPENYRGLGNRTDARERGRLTELFYAQTERGAGINPGLVDIAIKQHIAKQSALEVKRAKQKANP